MRRSTLILVLALAVIVIGGGAYLWWQKDSLSWPWSTAASNANTTTTNAPVVNTAASTNTTTTLPTEVKGDKEVTGTMSNGTITVTFDSQSRTTASDGLTAGKGERLLVVYFDPVASVSGTAVTNFLKDVTLTDGQHTYTIKALRVASASTTNDRGHLTFLIPDNAKNLVLELGSGANVQRVPLL